MEASKKQRELKTNIGKRNS